jgi:hypothetical protein
VRVGTILKKHLRNLRITTNVNVMHANRQKLHANCITINEVLISTIKKLALFIIFSGVNHNDLRKEVVINGYTSGDGGA